MWYSWPTLSKLRRAELRAKSTKALSKTRRQSVAHTRRLLEGELRVTIQRLGADGQAPASEAGGAALAGDGRCRVSLTGERLELQAGDRPPLQLELVAGRYPQLKGDGKELTVEGTLHGDTGGDGGAGSEGEQKSPEAAAPSSASASAATAAMDLAMEYMLNIDARGDDADAADASRLRARLTLSLMPGAGAQPLDNRKRSLLGVLMTSRRRGSASGAGPSLQDWFAAISREVPSPELSLTDASTQLRRMRLAPILMVFELRCFYWELATPADRT